MNSHIRSFCITLAALTVGLAALFASAQSAAQVAHAKPIPRMEPEPLIFSSAPREPTAEARAIYGPIADYLSVVLERPVEYRYTESWLEYNANLLADKYDLVFDGPHFVGWRIAKRGHAPILRLPQPQTWKVVVHPNYTGNVSSVGGNMGGRTFCAHAPPNHGAIVLQSLFTNPMRQPSIVRIQGWKNAFQGVVDRTCIATILPAGQLSKFDPDGTLVRVIHTHAPFPNLAITGGHRITSEIQGRIASALLNKNGEKATQKLRAKFTKGAPLVRATADEYPMMGSSLCEYMELFNPAACK